MNIGIIFGGKSFEHDISIITANTIYQILKDKYIIHMLYIDQNGFFKYVKKMDVEKFIDKTEKTSFNFVYEGIKVRGKKQKIDVLINAMHGFNGEDGLASVIANLYNIPFVGSWHIPSAVLMDKHYSYAILKENGIPVLDTKILYKNDSINLNIDFPIIVKPARLGSSIGINICENITDLNSLLKNAFDFDDKVVIQPFIKEFREINQAIYYYNNDYVCSKVEEVFKTDIYLSFDDKYIKEVKDKKKTFLEDTKIIETINLLSKKIYKLFELSGVVRIDYMIIGEEIFINEINTTPGSLSFYMFDDGLSLLKRLIYEALKNHQNKRSKVFLSHILYQKNFTKK